MASTNYTEENFPEVVKGDEFLNLTREEVCYLISSDQLSVGSEERVFESVINWVRHDVQSRKKCLPDLLEHVRMPLLSKGKDQYMNHIRPVGNIPADLWRTTGYNWAVSTSGPIIHLRQTLFWTHILDPSTLISYIV